MSGKISVIVPAYNVEKYIEKCINSIVSQSYQNLEIIIVNDGSTDKTKEICENFAKTDSRVKLINKQNGGVASARNEGLCAVSGDYIGWVDGDDSIEPNHFENLLNKLIAADADIAVIDNKTESVETQPQILQQYFLHNISCFLWSTLYKAELFLGERFQKYNVGEDFLIGIAVLSHCKKLVRFKAKTYNYLSRNESLLHNDKWQFRLTNFDATDFGRQYVKNNLPEFEKYYNYHILNDNMWHYRATQKLEKTAELKAFHKKLRKQVGSIIFDLPKGEVGIKKRITGVLFALHLI